MTNDTHKEFKENVLIHLQSLESLDKKDLKSIWKTIVRFVKEVMIKEKKELKDEAFRKNVMESFINLHAKLLPEDCYGRRKIHQ